MFLANDKLKMVVNSKNKNAGSEGPPSGRDTSLRKWHGILERYLAQLLHWAMSDPGGAILDYDFEYFLLHYAISFYPVDICFRNDRNTPMSKEMSPVIVNGLQELVKVILVTKLNSLSIYWNSLIFWLISDIWRVDTSLLMRVPHSASDYVRCW